MISFFIVIERGDINVDGVFYFWLKELQSLHYLKTNSLLHYEEFEVLRLKAIWWPPYGIVLMTLVSIVKAVKRSR